MKKVFILLVLAVLTVVILVLANLMPPYFNKYQPGETLLGDTFSKTMISGQVFFKDNEQPVQSGYVKALRYDWFRDLIITVDSSGITGDGRYNLAKCPSESLFIAAYADDELDFAPGYYDTTISWLKSVTVIPFTSVSNVNIGVNRVIKQENGTNRVGGRILRSPNIPPVALRGAIIYTVIGNKFKSYAVSNERGNYLIDSLPSGNMLILVERIGYHSDYRYVQVGPFNTDSIHFYLARVASVNPPVEFVPEDYALYQNYPNPFNPVTKISFSLPLPSHGGVHAVRLVVYDIIGREVAVLIPPLGGGQEGLKPGTPACRSLGAGRYEVVFDGTNYPSGVYFYELYTGEFIETRKMLLLK
jgi:hypothetical protein